ncbi:nitrile hydratase subunit beta [Pseudomonadales bacterium]|jgi:hypothetical protein|nr:nitrile hydratase subunit beta [Pseudomonadales bacterium]MDC1314127.1 nitrile hydratase subunit beta [Pseudomonadales bacterium]
MSDLRLHGDTAPPMRNGEMVFEAPWQNRLFGIAEAMCQQGYFDRNTFRVYLIRAIAQWEAENLGQPDHDYAYFDCFQVALAELLHDTAAIEASVLEDRVLELKARPHGHDHSHDHDHDHDHDH